DHLSLTNFALWNRVARISRSAETRILTRASIEASPSRAGASWRALSQRGILFLSNCCVLVFELPGLFFVISLQHRMRDGSGRFGSPSPIFRENRHDDLGIAIRREADKPCIISVLFAFQVGLFARDLSGTGFAADIEALDLRIDASSALIQHAPHRLGNDLDGGFLDRIILFNNLCSLKSELL